MNAAAGSDGSAPRRILLVDDDDDFLEMITLGLQLQGYTVAPFRNPVRARDAFMNNPEEYWVIVSDFLMKEISGFEFLDEIRRVSTSVRIILMSGIAEVLDDSQLRNLGVERLLVKPTTPNDIAQVIGHEPPA